ncbi:MAG: hypothetical protein IJS97_09710 [Prevotella sp.]|nr:hypothetical protein [Prevotella sp.]
MSLYRHIEGSREYFYLVDEEGNVEELCHLPAVSFGEEESQKAYKKAYLSAVRIFKKSPYTINLFGQTRMERDKLTQLVRAYDEEYCAESGNCVQYSYEAKKTIGVKPHFVVEAGYDFGEVRVGGYTFKGNMPQFSAGCEFEFPRLSKNFYAHALLFYSPWEVKAKNHSKDIKVKFKYGGLMLGGGYKLTKWGFVQPFVNAGIRFAHYSNLKGAHVGSYLTSDQSDSGYNVDLYGGTGLRVPIKKIQLMVTMNYSGSIMKERDKTTVSGLTLKASVVY